MNLGLSSMLVAGIALVALAGCGARPPVKSFLGASYPQVGYREIQPRAAPLRLHLAVEFQRNGEPFPKGDVPLKDYANRILVNSGVILPVEEGGEGEIRIVLNNIADSDTVAVEAARRALPLWMLGKTITDTYEMSMSITSRGKVARRTGIQHAVHTAIGNMAVPEEVQSFPQNQAFGKVLEQMLLRALKDMQRSGELNVSVRQAQRVQVASR
jgi:hypothetical protein